LIPINITSGNPGILEGSQPKGFSLARIPNAASVVVD
jgi:hypothetical protein